MKKLIFFILLLILAYNYSFSQSGWFIQSSVPTSQILRDVDFINTITGWSVGDSGTIIRTTNGGVNWNLQYCSVYTILHGVSFVDPNSGIIVGQNEVILKTTNGGINWITIISGGFTMYDIFYVNSNTGYAVGYHTWIRKTVNGGYNWYGQDMGLYNNLYCVSFCNADTGITVGEGGLIIRTTNGGDWTFNGSTGTDNYGVTYANALTWFVVGLTGTLYKSSNCGTSWDIQVSGTTADLFGVSFVNVNTGTVVGASGTILRTTNGGSNWIAQTSGTSSDLYGVCFKDENTGYCVGQNGTILKTTNGGVPVGFKSISSEIPSSFSLSQNYPNPFNPVTKIKFQIAKISDVKLMIYDVMGREIKTLINQQLSPGTYKTKWDAFNYPSGVYFYKLNAGNYSDTKRMVLIK